MILVQTLATNLGKNAGSFENFPYTTKPSLGCYAPIDDEARKIILAPGGYGGSDALFIANLHPNVVQGSNQVTAGRQKLSKAIMLLSLPLP